MNWKVFLAASAALAFAVAPLACSSDSSQREVCANGVDDDGNGKTDCDDPDCAGQAGCINDSDGGYLGTCPKCGINCQRQSQCVVAFVDDRPLPYCTTGRCTALETFVQVRVFMDTKQNWSGLGVSPRSGATRFIKKTAADGSAVTCARLQATAADKTKSSAIEEADTYVIQGLDVTRITNPQLGQGITYAFVNTQTGGDFLIWAELWGGPPDSTTKMPTGNRLGWGCYDTAAVLGGPITTEDNCPSTTSDAGTCRIFTLVMPPPE